MEHYVYHNLSGVVFLFLAYFVNHVLVNRQLCRPDSSFLYDHNSSPASCSPLSLSVTPIYRTMLRRLCHSMSSVRPSVCLSDRLWRPGRPTV